MLVHRDALHREPAHAAQNLRIRGIVVRRAHRHCGRAGDHLLAVLAAVRRTLHNAHAIANAVGRAGGAHVDDIDLEIRVGEIVVDDCNRQILAMLARMFEHGEAHVVLDALLPRNERLELPLRRRSGQHEHLGGRFRTGADHQIPLIEGEPYAHPEFLVVFLVHNHVAFDRLAHLVPANRIWALRVVEQRGEHIAAIGREARRSQPVELVGQLFAGVEVANAEVILFVAGRVDAEQQPCAVLRDVHAADLEEIVALGLCVGVEDHLFAGDHARRIVGINLGRRPIVLAADRHAALHAVLLALLRACVVPVAVQSRGHRHVGLLHMRAELVE